MGRPDNPDIKNLFIRNNIIVGNGGADIEVSRATSVTVENNLLSTAVSNAIGAALTASNNTLADPRFVNAAGNDYHLQSGSPAIDQAVGTDVAAVDYDGRARPFGVAADLGAYEFGAAPGAGTGGRAGSGDGGAAGTGDGTGGAAGAATGDGTGGAVGPATGGVAGGTGEAGKTGPSGCECNTGADASASPLVLLLLGLAALAWRRRA
jgi:MYXO-CTERM domain-containing protein